MLHLLKNPDEAVTPVFECSQEDWNFYTNPKKSIAERIAKLPTLTEDEREQDLQYQFSNFVFTTDGMDKIKEWRPKNEWYPLKPVGGLPDDFDYFVTFVGGKKDNWMAPVVAVNKENPNMKSWLLLKDYHHDAAFYMFAHEYGQMFIDHMFWIANVMTSRVDERLIARIYQFSRKYGSSEQQDNMYNYMLVMYMLYISENHYTRENGYRITRMGHSVKVAFHIATLFKRVPIQGLTLIFGQETAQRGKVSIYPEGVRDYLEPYGFSWNEEIATYDTPYDPDWAYELACEKRAQRLREGLVSEGFYFSRGA